MIEDLNSALRGVDATQRRIKEVTGTAWSEDHLIKAVVGPRGQLIELEIDPRAVRRVNTDVLSATITATVRSAAEQAMGRAQEVVEQQVLQARKVVGDAFGTDVPVGPDFAKLAFTHDADLTLPAREVDDELE